MRELGQFRVAKSTVQGKHYTFLGGTQDPRIFEILRALAVDESPNVRLKCKRRSENRPRHAVRAGDAAEEK
jgi:hypothetical protein